MKKSVNCITINTDASFCPKTNAAGWAFFIICNEFKVELSGTFKATPFDCHDAETKCIGQAIHWLINFERTPLSKTIIINTDSKYSIHRITNKRTPVATKINGFLQKLIKQTECKKFEFRYVKAHNGTPDGRSFVNDWCDKAAKSEMYKQRQKFLKHKK